MSSQFNKFTGATAYYLSEKRSNRVKVLDLDYLGPNSENQDQIVSGISLFDWRQLLNLQIHQEFSENAKIDRMIESDHVMAEVIRYVLYGYYKPRRQNCTGISSKINLHI